MPEAADAAPLPPDRIGVLVVEDEPLLRMDLSDRLEEAGLAVFETHMADAAVPILEARSDIRVVITDVDFNTGHLSGFDLARMIARLYPQIGVVITSGRARPTFGDLPEGMRFLPKPCSSRELIGIVFGFVEDQSQG